MAKTPPAPIYHDPELDELQARTNSMLGEFYMTAKDHATRDGPRNLRVARALKAKHGLQLAFSGEEHGADAWILREILAEEIEMKSAFEGNGFQFYTDVSRETPDLLDRLSKTSYVFSVWRRDPAGEQLVAVYYLPAGSGLNKFFEERLAAVSAGGSQIRKALGLRAAKDFGAIQLI